MKLKKNYILAKKEIAKDNYKSVQLATSECPSKKLTKSYLKQFEKINQKPQRFIREIRDMETELNVGDQVPITIWKSGDFVNVTAISKGKGFAGAIKRHNYSRGPMSHGSHHKRRPGSMGAITQNRVFPGKKLPGHMGHEQVTVQNLQVLQVNEQNSALVIKGSVPGPNKSLLIIKEAFKKSCEPIKLSNIVEVEAKNKILAEATKYQLKLTTEMSLKEMQEKLDAAIKSAQNEKEAAEAKKETKVENKKETKVENKKETKVENKKETKVEKKETKGDEK